MQRTGQTVEAIRQFQTALAIKPGYEPARRNLENVQRTIRP